MYEVNLNWGVLQDILTSLETNGLIQIRLKRTVHLVSHNTVLNLSITTRSKNPNERHEIYLTTRGMEVLEHYTKAQDALRAKEIQTGISALLNV